MTFDDLEFKANGDDWIVSIELDIDLHEGGIFIDGKWLKEHVTWCETARLSKLGICPMTKAAWEALAKVVEKRCEKIQSGMADDAVYYETARKRCPNRDLP